MDKQEIKQLLIQIKVFFPRFEAVEKDGNRYGVMTQTVDAWHRQIGWMDYDRALQILDQYMSSENGSKTPNVSLWIRGGKIQQASIRCTGSLDLRHGVIRWEPERGEVYERKIVRENAGTFEDEDGYMWAKPGGEDD